MHDQLHGGIDGINKLLLSVLSDSVHTRELVLAVLGPAWQVSGFSDQFRCRMFQRMTVPPAHFCCLCRKGFYCALPHTLNLLNEFDCETYTFIPIGCSHVQLIVSLNLVSLNWILVLCQY